MAWLRDICSEIYTIHSRLLEKSFIMADSYWNDKYIHPFNNYGRQRIRMFKNMVMKKLFKPERDKWTKQWRKLCNEVFYGWCTSPDIVRMMK
jgi:hypothetical protein